ncbi:FxSxx-COOH system tetratricopeptide repeat protein [Ktedonosporobacter rubrisoli]|nr:FxSxx-COOH system tetratricopeptide repeat protein [Ktedonosporobacter rubrisoli]
MDSIEIGSFGELLRAYRKKRHMKQQVLAAQLGVHYNTISKWERGLCLPDSKGMVIELAKLLWLNERETRLLLEASLTALSPYWLVPYQRNPFFAGRRELVDKLHNLLNAKAKKVARPCALTGLGGIGKTQLALEYAYRYANEYHAVFWVAAETQESILSSFLAIANLLRLAESEEKDQLRTLQAVLRWLSTHKEWLLIFDNVEDLALLKQYFPTARQGAIILTTRLHGMEGLAYPLNLSALSAKEGFHFLLLRSGLLDTLEADSEYAKRTQTIANLLVQDMEGLPLALDQAGAYIEFTKCSLADYRGMFQSDRIKLLNERSELAAHPLSVVKTFLLSFEQLTRVNAVAAELLKICALLAPEAIPEEFFTQGGPHLSSQLAEVTQDPYLFNQMIGAILSYSLLTRQQQSHTFSMHRLVQAVLRETMSGEEQKQWQENILVALEAIFPMTTGTGSDCGRLISQAFACVHACSTWQYSSLILASLLYKMADYLRSRADYGQAETLYKQALEMREEKLGAHHLDMAPLLCDLGNLYREQGKYERAEKLYQQALEIQRQEPGVQQLKIASSLKALANLYRRQGKFKQAGHVYQQVLEIQEQALGPDHLETACVHNGLAIVNCNQGNYQRAEQFSQYALRVLEGALGSKHPDVASALNNQAIVYYEQGKYEQAEELYQRSRSIREEVLGLDHPDTIASISNLAGLYCEQGKYAQAEELSLHARSQWVQALGADHPDTAYPLLNLARIAHGRGNYEQAEALYKQTLEIWERTLGTEHPDVAEALNYLANLYYQRDEYQQAEVLYQRALFIREVHLPPRHLLIAQTLYDFAMLRQAQSRNEEALALYQRALDIRQEIVGWHDPRTNEVCKRIRILQGKSQEE